MTPLPGQTPGRGVIASAFRHLHYRCGHAPERGASVIPPRRERQAATAVTALPGAGKNNKTPKSTIYGQNHANGPDRDHAKYPEYRINPGLPGRLTYIKMSFQK